MTDTQQKKRLLIVDDSPINIKILSFCLKENYDILSASSGKQAIDYMSDNPLPDLILLDIVMPDIDGYEVCKRLKASRKTRNIPVIFVTSVKEEGYEAKGLEVGAVDYILKPFNSDIINARVKTHIELKQYRDHLESQVRKRTEELGETNRTLYEHRSKLQHVLDKISSFIQNVVDKKDLTARFFNPNLQKCYEIMNCTNETCLCYGKEPMRCWMAVGSYCGGKISGTYTAEQKNCSNCPVYRKATEDHIYEIGENFNNMMHIIKIKHTELEKAYYNMKTSQEHMLKQEKMASIGQLAAGVAHEINNPMGFISSNLGTLEKYVAKFTEFIQAQSDVISYTSTIEELEAKRKKLKLDYVIDDVKELINESLDGSERVKLIVQNLKTFSRQDESNYKFADINECIQSTLNIVWSELKYKVTINNDYGKIPRTKCYPQQLNQVFMNLLVNAGHAIDKAGEISIKTWNGDGSIYISISDTGRGIPEDKIEKIFDPFFTTKPAGEGTGLGLNISYNIVEKHNGEITVRSEEGKGTTFTIQLPVIE